MAWDRIIVLYSSSVVFKVRNGIKASWTSGCVSNKLKYRGNEQQHVLRVKLLMFLIHHFIHLFRVLKNRLTDPVLLSTNNIRGAFGEFLAWHHNSAMR